MRPRSSHIAHVILEGRRIVGVAVDRLGLLLADLIGNRPLLVTVAATSVGF